MDAVAEARRWLGTPFLHQARLRGVGCDCIGLVMGVALAIGVPNAEAAMQEPALYSYGRSPDPAVLLGACDRYLERITEPGLGDILVMRFASDPQHFAIVSGLNPTYIIHAHQRAGGVVEHVLDAKWAKRTLRAYRFKWQA